MRSDLPTEAPSSINDRATVVRSEEIGEGSPLPKNMALTWAVDLGDRMDAMSTFDLWMALSMGELPPSVKVWRLGRAGWDAADSIPELICALKPRPVLELDSDTVEARETKPFGATCPPVSKGAPAKPSWLMLAATFALAFGVSAGSGAAVAEGLRPSPDDRTMMVHGWVRPFKVTSPERAEMRDKSWSPSRRGRFRRGEPSAP